MLTNQTYIYYNRDSSWPIVNVFIRDSRLTASWPMLKTKLNQIQIIEAQNSMRGDFIELNVSHDRYWMKHMYDIGKRYAVIWYDGCWPTDEKWNMSLLETIDKWNKHEEPWAVAGHILLDRKINKNKKGREAVTSWRDTIEQYDYPHWHHQCLIMNLQSWKEIGWPDLDQEWSNDACANYKPSDEHMHDHYTPTYVDGLPGLLNENEVEFVNQPGNVLIVKSLNNRYRVWNLPDELRCNKVSVYPEEGSKHLEDLLIGKKTWDEVEPHVDEDAIWLQNYVFQSYENFIYLINTEVTNTNWYCARETSHIKFNNYVGVAAGWKLLHHMFHHGWEKGTEVTWYDISGPSVELKQYLVENWDGRDYERVAIEWCEKNGYHAHNGHQIPERMNLLYEICGGFDSWLDFWNRVTTECKFKFIQLDMVYDVDQILEHVPEDKTTLFYASNLYSYLPNIIRCGINLEKSFVDLITGLRKKNPNNFYEGTDVADNQLFQRVTSIESARVNVATEEE